MTEDRLDLKKTRIRRFFLTLEKKKEGGEVVEEKDNKLLEEGMKYIQLHLPIDKITEAFEETVKKNVKSKVVKADIREADESDLDVICHLYNRAWLTSHEPFSQLDTENLRAILNDPDTKIFIAKVYGSDAGFLIIDREGPNKEYGVIIGLGVLPRFQRKGIGTILGMEAWKYFKEQEIKELRTEVYIDNKVSYNFIKSLGFEECGMKVYTTKDFLLEEE